MCTAHTLSSVSLYLSVSISICLSLSRTHAHTRTYAPPPEAVPRCKLLPLHLASFASTQASGETSGLQETDGVAEILEADTYTQAPVSSAAPCHVILVSF